MLKTWRDFLRLVETWKDLSRLVETSWNLSGLHDRNSQLVSVSPGKSQQYENPMLILWPYSLLDYANNGKYDIFYERNLVSRFQTKIFFVLSFKFLSCFSLWVCYMTKKRKISFFLFIQHRKKTSVKLAYVITVNVIILLIMSSD